jgi:hypothetical protein
METRPSAAAQRHAARTRAAQRQAAAAQHVAARLHRPAVPGAAVVVMTMLLIGVIVAGTVFGTGMLRPVEGGPALSGHVAEVLTGAGARHGPAPIAPIAPIGPLASSAPLAADARPGLPSSGVSGERTSGAGLRGPGLSEGQGAAAASPEEAHQACGPRTLLVNAHADPASPATLAVVDRAVSEQERAGRTVCRDDVDAIARLFVLLPRWLEGDLAADESIEDLLEERGYASILWITGRQDDRSAAGVLLVNAEREGAQARIGACGE